MTSPAVHAPPGLDVLDDLDMLRDIEHLAACDRLMAVARFVSECGTSTVDPATEGLPGRQRAVTLGGEGTPRIAEFLPALAAGRLAISAWSGARLVADVLDLVHRLPRVWASLCSYDAKASYARLVASKSRHLSTAQAAQVDARMAESCDGRLGYGRFLSVLDGVVADVDAEAVARREAEALTEEFARTTQTTQAGMRGFYVRAPFPVIARLDATVAHLADALEALGHGGTLDERRVLAVLVLADPVQATALLSAYHAANRAAVVEGTGSGNAPEAFTLDLEKLLPAVVLYVHLSEAAITSGTGVARVEGLGHGSDPVTAQWVRRWLGPRARFTVKPVLVPEQQSPVDAYEVPARHREAVHLLSPADVFPWAANTTRAVQIDHTEPYDPGGPPGQSRIGNYGPMTTFHHRLKTHGGWQCTQPFPGIYLWRDPSGATYLVDHSGTRRVRPAA